MGSCSGRCTLLALCALQLVSPGVLLGSPGPAPTSGGSWDNLVSGRVSRLTGMQGEQPPCWTSAVPCYVCSGSGVPVGGTGAGELLGALAARNKSLRAGLSPELHSLYVVRSPWSVVPLMPTRSEGACGQEFECYRSGTSGGARSSKVQSVPECGHLSWVCGRM